MMRKYSDFSHYPDFENQRHTYNKLLSELYSNISYREATLVGPVLLRFPEAAAVAPTEVLQVQLQSLLLSASLGLS